MTNEHAVLIAGAGPTGLTGFSLHRIR